MTGHDHDPITQALRRLTVVQPDQTLSHHVRERCRTALQRTPGARTTTSSRIVEVAVAATLGAGVTIGMAHDLVRVFMRW